MKSTALHGACVLDITHDYTTAGQGRSGVVQTPTISFVTTIVVVTHCGGDVACF